MSRIDAHNHFWKFDLVRDSWINDEMKVIQRDFLPAELEPILAQNGFEGCVVVQSDQSEAENAFQLQNAAAHPFIKGIVGWVDLQAANINERLQYYRQFDKIKGFRHVLQGEPQRDLMLHPSFLNGLKDLKRYDFTYDILIFPDQLPYIPKMVAQFPDQPFVLDHIAKPPIKAGEIKEWKKAIAAVADFENVFCKISGMVTEADWQGWKGEDFYPYMDAVVESFGTNRIMFGSDWPVCQVAASYAEVVGIVAQYLSTYSKAEQEQFFGINASRFYKL